jgi:hypothetical protein
MKIISIRSLLFILFVGILLISSFPVCAQLGNSTGYSVKGNLSAEPGIVLLVQNVQNPCGGGLGAGMKKTFFRLKMSGIKSKYASGNLKYMLNLRLKFEDCKGKQVTKTYVIDLNRYNADGENRNEREWYYEGSRLIFFEGDIKQIEQTAVACENILPSEIYASADRIKPGESVRLSVSGDGKLCSKAQWVWYADNCGNVGNIVGSGRTGIVTDYPKKKTTYWVRAEDGKKVSNCVSKTIYVEEVDNTSKQRNRAPVRSPVIITGGPANPICKGEKINLSVSGGLEQSSKKWVWRAQSCNGTVIGTTSNLSNFSVNETTIIYVRDENDDSIKECSEVKIEVKPVSVLPNLSINNGSNIIMICEGEAAQLSVTGVQSNVTRLRWFKDNINNSSLSSSSNYSPYPTENTVYYVQGEGDCKTTTNVATIKVNVTKKSIAPSRIVQTKLTGKNYKLNVVGGSLEAGANWKWYKGNNCTSGSPIDEGSEITYNYKNGNVVSLRAEGGSCGMSSCVSHTISVPAASKGFGFVNVGMVDLTFSNFSLTVGGKKFYLRYKTGIKSVSATKEITYDNAYGYIIPAYPITATDYYQFNGQKNIKRSGYTAGVMLGGKSVRFYLGGGIGEITPSWGVDIVNYANPSSKSTTWGTVIAEQRKGPELEAGIFLKFGKLNVMSGINVINDKTNGQYIDGTLGIGITF